MKRLVHMVIGAGAIAGFIACARLAPYGIIWYPPAVLMVVATVVIVRRRRSDRPAPVPDVRARRTTEIGEAWMLTSLLLQRSPSASDRLRLCHVRDVYLEEFSIRDPEGFQRWVTEALAGNRIRPDLYIRQEFRSDDEANRLRRILRQYLAGARSARLHR